MWPPGWKRRENLAEKDFEFGKVLQSYRLKAGSSLLYCSTMILPIVEVPFVFGGPVKWWFQLYWYIILGLGIWIILRRTHSAQRYLVMMASIVLIYTPYALTLYWEYKKYPASSGDMPFWGHAVFITVEGIILLGLIALPAMLELYYRMRSGMDAEEPALD